MPKFGHVDKYFAGSSVRPPQMYCQMLNIAKRTVADLFTERLSLIVAGEERKEDPENTKMESGKTRGCASSGGAPPQPEKEVEKCNEK